ncbi:hypothetical protein [Burkholderia stagnalis]|uniref:hypothetical protein n=1 Tax=Burkholderia stagnalis TaxID=1503054 RepID=UPI0012DA5760|nr:hypothetical protein [Burkholderia stagnalis]
MLLQMTTGATHGRRFAVQRRRMCCRCGWNQFHSSILHFVYDICCCQGRSPRRHVRAGGTEARKRMSDCAIQQEDEALGTDPVYVGISVATEIVEISVSSLSVILGYRNETFGIESLTDAIAEWSPALIVLEAAGGLELEVACALQAVRLPVVVVNPHHARDFVAGAAERSLEGKGARARMLAELACVLVRHPSCSRIVAPLSDPQLRYVQALVQRRRQLARTLMAEYQLLAWCHSSVRGGIEQTIAFLKNQIGVVDRHCARHVSAQRADVARALARVKRADRDAPAGRAGDFMAAWRVK